MADRQRITCEGICSRPVAYEQGSNTYVSYIYRAGDDLSLRFRDRSRGFITETTHSVSMAWPVSAYDGFTGTALDTDKWNDNSSNAGFVQVRDGVLRLVAGLTTDSDDFAGTDIDTNKWSFLGNGNYISQNGTLDFIHASGEIAANTSITSLNKISFTGDFDLHVNINNAGVGTSLAGDQYARLHLNTIAGSNHVYAGLEKTSLGAANWKSEYFIGGVSQAVATVTSAPASGWIRISRSGATLSTQYGYSGNAVDWQTLQTFSLPAASGTIYADIEAQMRQDAFDGFNSHVDDFSVVSGPGTGKIKSVWKLIDSYEFYVPWKIHRMQAPTPGASGVFYVGCTSNIFDTSSFRVGIRKGSDNTMRYFGDYTSLDSTQSASIVGPVVPGPTGWFRLTRDTGGTMQGYFGSPEGGWTGLFGKSAASTHNQNIEIATEIIGSSYPVVDVYVEEAILASGGAYYTDPTTFDVDIQDGGAMELLFVTGDRVFKTSSSGPTTAFTDPQGLIIFNEGSKIVRAFDASISHDPNLKVLTYIDQDRRVRVASSADGGISWASPTLQNSIIVSSGTPTTIDSIYDSDLGMFTATWDSEADGEYDVLYTSFGLTALASASGNLVTAETPTWEPVVEAGYFYFEDREYYLYADKQCVFKTWTPPSGTVTLPTFKRRPILGPPIVVTTSPTYSIVDASGTPFAKTWEPPIGEDDTFWDPTPNKYRRRWDLTDRKEFEASPSGQMAYEFDFGQDYRREFYVNWGTPDSNGWYTPTATIINTEPAAPSNVIIEWENPTASGFYVVRHVDLNPLHTPNTVNRFLILRETLPTKNELFMDVADPYILGASGSTHVFATVYDDRGSPVQGAIVNFSLSPDRGDNSFGTLDSNQAVTNFDGSCAIVYTAPNDVRSLIGGMGAGVIIQGTVVPSGTSTDAVRIELGLPAGN